MVKKGGIVRQYPPQRESEKPAYPGQKPQYKPGFGPQGKIQKQIPKPVSNFWIIIIIIITVIVLIISVYYFISPASQPGSNGNNENSGSSNDCTCYCGDGITDCTANHHICPSDNGVPGVCGCPVSC